MLNSWSITVKTAGVFLEPYAITDDNGNYSFTNLPPGQYFVREHFSDDQKAAGWTQSIAPSPVTVRSVQQSPALTSETGFRSLKKARSAAISSMISMPTA